ncbi:diguanylate cyclase (GGDEF) domain-containing protein [Marinospirillum celere]|uniref:Diguanylate cyclase (GGDEF) domain-containing protein n=1 Tax=Marinospirillum celere TaxID=1122252 RepID=A0A1I1EHK4_9GAMM|nr:sensor domain-containing diguanylate cyclase [Marinospirillum celere]SFB84433.1 diguanylate cyclase (GGDEF) domain-containing protein [Marinospirillum celere]
MTPSAVAYEISNCEKEPIHTPAAIQPDGLLLVIEPRTFNILQASANTKDWLGIDAEQLLGTYLPDLLGEELNPFLDQILSHPSNYQPNLLPIEFQKSKFVLRGHHNAGGILVEMEPLPKDDQLLTYRLFTQLNNFFHELELTSDPERLLKMAAKMLRKVTGHESVMVYKFDNEWNGQIIIEDRADGQERFKGHHFPASDIPAQARRLYRINRVRRISNANYTPVPLVPATNPLVGDLDMTLTQLRSVSPIHLEYMRNMGTASSLTLSLMPDGHLWGMIVCHGDQPNYVSQPVRTFCKMVTQLVSENLQLALNRQFNHQMTRLGRAIDQFNAPFQATYNLHEGLAGLKELLDPFESDAIFLRLDGIDYQFGREVDAQEMQCLRSSVRHQTHAGMAYAEHLPENYQGQAHWICGYLFLPLAASGDEYMIFLRKERPLEVTWAGKPAKAVREELTPGEFNLSPRESFEKWTEKVRGQSLPWERHHRAAASRLRRAINLRMATEMVRLRQHDAEMAHLATHDALTGLPNRLLVDDRLEQALAKARRERGAGAVLFVDLDGFKPINDRYGHDVGDKILCLLSHRLSSSIRESDTFARLGGDEFLFIITGFSSKSTTLFGAETLACKLLESLKEPFVVNGQTFQVGASIGIAIYPFDADEPNELIKKADQAMYVVKETGRSNYHFYADGSP